MSAHFCGGSSDLVHVQPLWNNLWSWKEEDASSWKEQLGHDEKNLQQNDQNPYVCQGTWKPSGPVCHKCCKASSEESCHPFSLQRVAAESKQEPEAQHQLEEILLENGDQEGPRLNGHLFSLLI